MWKFIRYEWKYWLSSPMLWIFLFINTLFVAAAVSSDNVQIGGGVGSVHKNAPFVIQGYYGVISVFFSLLMTTAFMNATANRDFQYNMYQFVFSSPIHKRDYFFGKFIGAAVISVIPLLGVSLGALIGPLLPWAEPERYGDVMLSGHIQGLLTFGIPNVLITGIWLYTLAIIFRSTMVSFIGAILILVLYGMSQGFTSDIQKEWIANIIDPFGFRPRGIMSKYLTVDEKNLFAVPLSGPFLVNRLLWLGISFLILAASYFRFSFNSKKEKITKEKKKTNDTVPVFTNKTYQPSLANRFSFYTLWYLIKMETKAVIKNPVFIIIVVIGLINLVASLTSFTGRYGGDQYPVTYDVIDSINGAFYIFIVAIITFYSGVLVWKERDAKINEIQDSAPVQTGLLFTSKVIAMVFSIAIILACTILIGVTAQTAFGYTHFQLDVYVKSLLVLGLLKFTYFIVIALFFHYLINNRYIAYFAFVAFLIVNSFIWSLLEMNSNMLKFGATPDVTYSDMNGFGPFVKGLTWFNIYWFVFSLLLCFVIFAFYIRGKESGFRERARAARPVLAKNKLAISILLLCFLICGSFIYYNTKVLNSYDSDESEEKKQVDYEKTYKKFENLVQPRYIKLNYAIDLDPYERNMRVSIEAWVKNKSSEIIKELHFTMPTLSDSIHIDMGGAVLKLRDNRLNYRIFTLGQPLRSQDSILVKIDLWKLNKGFENEVSFTQLTQNGTFFNSGDILPVIGYNERFEISDKNKRAKLKLPKKIRAPKLNELDLRSRANTYISTDADWVDVSTVISTSPDQIAIAPGSLLKSWEANGRKYFNYKLDQKSLNFYSFISARYDVARKKWNGIDLEVYYIKQHAYNVPNMMKSLERSLDYYTKNFGPYYHKQCRIIEFPRYQSFAQAFPGTMPYSEGIGFIADLRNVTDADIDQVYYVVAHEMGHQYWAHQICGAGMQGSEWMSEGFAQYSALMVMEKEYGKDKMKKFLKYEMDGYLRGRSGEFEAERPLVKTEGQPYIHYQKASVAMYYLKEMIGEANVNKALRSLIDSFAYRQPPYPTSLSALRAFKQVTPDSLQYVLSDLFENITLFSNRMLEATYKKVGSEYEITLKTTSQKFRSDSLGKETVLPVADYIDIALFEEPEGDAKTGKILLQQRIRINREENTFTFRTKREPYQAGIDPYNYLIDRIPDDNIKILGEL